MQIILLGPPGAGKGTQAVLVAREGGVPHISTGDILRAAVHEGTDLGKLAKSYMDRGDLVPDDVIIGIVRDRMQVADCRTGFVFDGFPRTVPQAEALDRVLGEIRQPLQAVINIDVADELLVQRFSGRRTCKECQAVYHVIANPPRVAGQCNRCGGELVQRVDDQEATVRNRLQVYHRQTAPLVSYYGRTGLLQTVDGTQPVAAVTKAIWRAIHGE